MSRTNNLAVAPEPDAKGAANEATPDAASKKGKKEKKPKKEGKPGGRKKLMIIAVLVLAVGGYAGYTFLGGGGAPEVEPAPEPGAVVPLESITVNLADGHFLKVRIALQATIEAAEAPDGSKALDLTISQFSNRELGELSSNEGRDIAKAELREKIVEAYHGEVMDVYLTEFVMQ